MTRAALVYLPIPASPRPAPPRPRTRRIDTSPFSRQRRLHPKPRQGVKNWTARYTPGPASKTHANPPGITQVTAQAVVGFSVAAERGALSPFTERYLAESGGRWGTTATRTQNYGLSKGLMDDGFSITGGGGLRSEEFIKGVGPGTKGGTFVDITARSADGRTVRIQTIDTLADGITPTLAEAAAAARIRAAFPNDELRLIPKVK